LIKNNINLIFFKVDGSPQKPWGSAEMGMEEEYSP
jgi:hypothetical protein